jgi:hypothetical protein
MPLRASALTPVVEAAESNFFVHLFLIVAVFPLSAGKPQHPLWNFL